jgi:tetratricopeptide (TPR) repeat protein
MDSGATQSDKFYNFLAWLEVNKKQVAWGVAIVAVAGLIGFFVVWNKNQHEELASAALSDAKPPLSSETATTPGLAAAYLKVAETYPNTRAAERARLLGATALYTQGEYQRALDQFQQFLRDRPESPWTPQASLGVAVCLDSLNRTKEAMTKYDELIKRYPNASEAIRARMELGRLYEDEGKPDLALKQYEELVKSDRFSSQGSMAALRAEDLRNKYPALAMTNVLTVVKTNAVSFSPTNVPNVLTLAPPKLVITNPAPVNPPKKDNP